MLGLGKKNNKKKPEKITPHQESLIKDFNNGKILQVDNKVDNKGLFKKIDEREKQ